MHDGILQIRSFFTEISLENLVGVTELHAREKRYAFFIIIIKFAIIFASQMHDGILRIRSFFAEILLENPVGETESIFAHCGSDGGDR